MAFLRKKGSNEVGRVLSVPVSSIQPNPNQPRKHFDPDGLRELAASIQELGILQPLTVRRTEDGWELIAGERRLRAAKLAGLSEVPCIQIHSDSQNSSLLALVENLQRRDLDFVEEAQALARLIGTYHLSQEETARRIGKSQSAVANKLRLLRLSPETLDRLRRNGLSERHARALLRLESEEQQREALDYVISHQFTVAQTDQYIEALLCPPKSKPKRTYVIKDVRLFLNTVNRALSVMRSAGVSAHCDRQDTEDAICLTIRIPR